MSENYPEAAKRHLEDSKVLLDAERWDDSAYLAGYVVECSIKACITTPAPPPGINVREIGHNNRALAAQLALMASSKKPGYRRSVSGIQIHSISKMLLNGFPWKETLRYEPSCYITSAEAKEWWTLASRVFSGLAKDLCVGD